MSKQYNSRVSRVDGQPRSARLRAMGGTRTTTYTTMVSPSYSIAGGGGSIAGHEHSNYEFLETLSSEDGYILISGDKASAGYADTAHDLDEDSPVYDKVLRKDQSDSSNYNYTFNGTLTINKANVTGRLDASQAILGMTAVRTYMVSVGASLTGFDGAGFGMTKDGDDVWTLEIDKLIVRRAMKVYEMLIEKIRATGGMVVVSPASGKIETVSTTTSQGVSVYRIAFEQANQYVAEDLIRCQEFTGDELRSYWVRVTAATDEYVEVPVAEFEGAEPLAGDETVLMGNTVNAARQSLVTIAATEDGQPRIQMFNGVNSKSLSGKALVILGGLDSTNFEQSFSEDLQPQGYGLAAQNVFLKGRFVCLNGTDVQTTLASFGDAITLLSGRFDSDGRLVNCTGLVVEDEFAALFAQEVTAEGLAKTAEIKVYVDDEIATARISADRIDMTADLVTTSGRIIAGDETSRHVSIDPADQSVTVYDGSGAERVRMDGTEFGGASEIYSDGGSAGDMSYIVRTSSVNGGSSGAAMSSGYVYHYYTTASTGLPTITGKTVVLTDPLQVTDPTEITVSSGMIKVTGTATYAGDTIPSDEPTPYTEVRMHLRLSCYEDEALTVRKSTVVLASAWVGGRAYEGGVYDDDMLLQVRRSKMVSLGPVTSEITDRKVVVTEPGYWVLEVWDQAVVGCSGSNARMFWGSNAGQVLATPSYATEFFISRQYANGACWGTRNDNYCNVWRDSGTGDMQFEIVNKSGYGLRVTSTGVAVRKPGNLSIPWTSL